MNIGYARASSIGQPLNIQWKKLQQAGCTKIFEEKIFSMNERENALEILKRGDVLIVTKLDRLARSLKDLKNIITHLQKKEVKLKVLDQSIDTTTSEGRQMFNMISSLAEFEHNIRQARRMDGVQNARNKGVIFGRKQVLTERQRQEIVRLNKMKSFSVGQLANKYAVSHMTIYRTLKHEERQNQRQVA